jgi:hypothetical protein
MNGNPEQKTWPETAPYNAAIDAFDAALTRAGHDAAFRKRLTDSPESAKAAVAEVGKISIPDDRVIVFYEPQPPKSPPAMAPKIARTAGDSHSSENVHVFYLPPFNEQGTEIQYTYDEFFMCCYDQWIRT